MKEKIMPYAYLCQAGYDVECELDDSKLELKGWKFESTNIDVPLEKISIRTYRKGNETVILFKVVDLDYKDILVNSFWLACKGLSFQCTDAVKYTRRIQAELQDSKKSNQHGIFCCSRQKVILIGHSLGGAIAEYVSKVLDLEAYTFDSPGIENTNKNYRLHRKHKTYNYVAEPNLINTFYSHPDGVIYLDCKQRNDRYKSKRKFKDILLREEKLTTGLSHALHYSSLVVTKGRAAFPQSMIEGGLKKAKELTMGDSIIYRTCFCHKLEELINDLETCHFVSINHWLSLEKLVSKLSQEQFDVADILVEPLKLLSKLEKVTHHNEELEKQIVRIMDFVYKENQTATSGLCYIL